jgi:glycosyltransferase involved in cell wall biosynthesis
LLVDRMSRPSYLQALQEAKVAVLIPNHTEGFFLPALETMALDVITVCPDCVGNRTFCADGQTAIMPGWEPAAIVDAAERALRLPNAERQSLLHRARKMAERHTLERERTAFQRVLRGLRSGEITPPPGLPDWIPTFAARWWA